MVTDAVFSMDGDIAPVPQLLQLCERFDAGLLLDDAHGFGVLGAGGAGVLEPFQGGLAAHHLHGDARQGGRRGGCFVAGAPDLIETLIQNARTYIYTTATPPLLAHALLASLEIMRREDGRRETLGRLIEQLKTGLDGMRWKLMASPTAIQPLIVGDNTEVLRVSARAGRARRAGPAIRPPTVPDGTARLRISLSAAHSTEDVARLVDALRHVEINS